MATPEHRPYPDMGRAMAGLVTAHAAVSAGIATHAEKHEIMLLAKRKAVAAARAIQQGAIRQSGQA